MKLLNEGDSVITVYTEMAKGPGWVNNPTWVIIREPGGRIREECIQPEDLNAEALWLMPIAQVAHKEFKAAVEVLLYDLKKRGA